MTNNPIEGPISRLKKSPLFYLFLASRELFHSNFWYWLSTLNKKETLLLFVPGAEDGEYKLLREHGQSTGEVKSKVDLFIHNEAGGSSIAIENKVKDFPTEVQLSRIRRSFGDQNVQLLLATLFTHPQLKFEGWQVRTYRQIAEAMDANKFTDDFYYRALINDYKSFTLELAALAEALPLNENYDFALSKNHNLLSKLDEVKLWEVYQKMRASHLVHQFDKEYNQHKAHLHYQINRKKATIDFFVDLAAGYKAGIQLENHRYRKIVIGKNADGFARNLINDGVFFNGQFRGRGNKPYLNYGSRFKYQYEVIDEVSFGELFARINSDLKFIKDNSHKFIANFPNT